MGFWGALSIAVASGIGAYFASYLREKGRNLATREDIAGLTKIVEDIKTENALLVERFKSQQQLRYAALDKRLQAHQDAYTLWRELVQNIYSDKEGRGKIVDKCNQWWDRNCLYLESDARNAFDDACFATSLSIVGVDTDKTEAAKTMEFYDERVRRAGAIIVKSVALPGLTASEEKYLKDSQERA